MPRSARWKHAFDPAANPVASLEVEAAMAVTRKQRDRHPLRVLVAHLFACFFASELPQSVFRPATLALQTAVALGVPPAVIVLCMFPAFIFPRSPWLQAQDHFYFITYSCVITGAVCVLTWERFLPTLLDARILTLLPITRSQLFLGKILAMVLFVGTFALGSSLSAAVLLAGFANTHHAGRHLVAHLVAVCLFSWFTATSLLTLLAFLSLLPRGVRRMAVPFAQGGLITLLFLLLFFSPEIAPWIQPLVSSRSAIALCVPPFWFTGIYEVILRLTPGSLIFARLAITGVIGTLLSTACFTVFYPLAYRRRTHALLEGEEVKFTHRKRFAASIPRPLEHYLPIPGQRASFYFIVQTLLRLQRFRAIAIFASCAGFALAATVMAKMRFISVAPFVKFSLSLPATTTITLLFVIIASVYLCLSANLEPRATWLFDSIVGREAKAVASRARRWSFLILGVIALAAFLILWPFYRGATFASGLFVRELIVLVAGCVLLVEIFFHGFREIPFATQRLRRRGMAATALVYIFVVFPVTLAAMRRAEVAAMRSWLSVALLLCFVTAVERILRRVRSNRKPLLPEQDEDEYFQRLGL